ncbi:MULTISPECIES: hypothetical protein [Paraburkholderia]|jgi:hypothetical protein|uniref:hypothetical protein n=1 Tax=Paraburkholderia TaxID=1822464 RepID=UPI0006D401A6|nr:MULTISPECIES: hypothetical protein [Paraburkholderia]
MAFKIGALAVAIVFAFVFALIQRKAAGEKYKGMRVASYGFPFAIIGLLAAVVGRVNIGVAFVVIAFPLYILGSIIHVKAMMQGSGSIDEK